MVNYSRTDHPFWKSDRVKEMVTCSGCDEVGLKSEDAEPGDENAIKIFEQYENGDSYYDGEWICPDCMDRFQRKEALIQMRIENCTSLGQYAGVYK